MKYSIIIKPGHLYGIGYKKVSFSLTIKSILKYDSDYWEVMTHTSTAFFINLCGVACLAELKLDASMNLQICIGYKMTST